MFCNLNNNVLHDEMQPLLYGMQHNP